jgi:hypothetical protein
MIERGQLILCNVCLNLSTKSVLGLNICFVNFLCHGTTNELNFGRNNFFGFVRCGTLLVVILFFLSLNNRNGVRFFRSD